MTLDPEQLLKALDSVVNEGDFASKVREYHAELCSKGLCDDDSVKETNRCIDRFKKYKIRLAENRSVSGKPYRELLDFYNFLKGSERIGASSFMFDLPDNLTRVMMNASKKIFEKNDRD